MKKKKLTFVISDLEIGGAESWQSWEFAYFPL